MKNTRKEKMEIILLTTIVLIGSIISGATALAGGTIILGSLFYFYPIADALVIHGILYLSINLYRIFLFRKHLDITLFSNFLIVAVLTYALLSPLQFIPEKEVSLILLGIVSISVGVIKNLPTFNLKNKTIIRSIGAITSGSLIFFGLHGPVLDIFFTKSNLTKEEILSTKSSIGSIGHILKIVYFLPMANLGSTVSPNWHFITVNLILVSLVGVYIGKTLVNKLSECRFRLIGRSLLSAIGTFYLIRGVIAVC